MFFKPREQYSIPDENDYPEWIKNVTDEIESYSVTGKLKVCEDTEIAYLFCLAENARGSVVIVHGYTEYYKKYYETAWYFLNEGYSVFMYDHRGHGHSSRNAGNSQVVHVDRFEEYAEDLEKFINDVVIPNTNADSVDIYSHSMGGAVTAMYLINNSSRIRRAVLSSPMVAPVTMGIPERLVRKRALKDCRKFGEKNRFKYTHSFSPNADFTKSADFSHSRFKYNLDVRIADENYQTSGGSNRWIYESMNVKKKLLDGAPKITVPVLMFVSQKDKVVKTGAQYKLAKRLPDCIIITVPGAKHSLYTHKKEYLTEYYKQIFAFLE